MKDMYTEENFDRDTNPEEEKEKLIKEINAKVIETENLNEGNPKKKDNLKLIMKKLISFKKFKTKMKSNLHTKSRYKKPDASLDYDQVEEKSKCQSRIDTMDKGCEKHINAETKKVRIVNNNIDLAHKCDHVLEDDWLSEKLTRLDKKEHSKELEYL